MVVTDLLRLTLCPEDFMLLDRMAAAAGKSRDVFVSDIMFEVLTMEHMIQGTYTKKARNGAH